MANSYTDKNGHVIYVADISADADDLAEMLGISRVLAGDIITDAWTHMEKMQDEALDASIELFLNNRV